jgi:hypothetical protein
MEYKEAALNRRDTARQSRNENQDSLNAETQRDGENRREKEASAKLCESLRLCVESSQPHHVTRSGPAVECAGPKPV